MQSFEEHCTARFVYHKQAGVSISGKRGSVRICVAAIKPAMSAEGAKAIGRWLSEAIPPVAEVAVPAPLRGATTQVQVFGTHLRVSGGVAPLNRRPIAGAPTGCQNHRATFVAQFDFLVRRQHTFGHHEIVEGHLMDNPRLACKNDPPRG